MQAWICHSAYACFALMRHFRGLKNLFSNTTKFLYFQMLQIRKDNYWSNLGLRADQTLCNVLVSSWSLSGKNCKGNHWCLSTSSQTLLPIWHLLKRWSIDSISIRQIGQPASIFNPLLISVPHTGIAWWQIFHKKILILGMVSIFQIHL